MPSEGSALSESGDRSLDDIVIVETDEGIGDGRDDRLPDRLEDVDIEMRRVAYHKVTFRHIIRGLRRDHRNIPACRERVKSSFHAYSKPSCPVCSSGMTISLLRMES